MWRQAGCTTVDLNPESSHRVLGREFTRECYVTPADSNSRGAALIPTIPRGALKPWAQQARRAAAMVSLSRALVEGAH